ncbi:MAG: mandelate racemase/muconate lactonizing enzyme family protein [Proteobacteria bacterium]|nr:mandelate racemase/muconate lactonizing enzyme family protein [Pseudomonadota bacterium]
MKPLRIRAIEPWIVNVSDKTNWAFVKALAEDGRAGLGEATLSGYEPLIEACVRRLSGEVKGKGIAEALAMCVPHSHARGGPVEQAVKSALDQALWDLRGQEVGLPVHELLGARHRDSVRVYANLNRGLSDRSPAGYAGRAREAVAAGFGAVKITPFDSVFWQDISEPATRKALALGVERIRASREAVGAGIDLMVDCHWRFTEAMAVGLLEETAEIRLFWLECPISESPENHAALARVRAVANELGVRLAGEEWQSGLWSYAPIIHAKAYDVVMPDIRYIGGYREFQAVARYAALYGVEVAPHNPGGPVMALASAHAAASIPNFLVLEHMYAESPLFHEVLKGEAFRPAGGIARLTSAPGLGVALNEELIRERPYLPVPVPVGDPRLG